MRIAILVMFACVSLYGAEVRFLAVGRPSFLKINGKCQGQAVKIDKVARLAGTPGHMFLAEVDLNSCDTGIDLRNHHMKEKYLETAKFPKAELKGTVWDGESSFKGMLTVHGKTVDVAGDFKEGMISFKTKISAFGIEIPSFAGVTVADDVQIEAPLVF